VFLYSFLYNPQFRIFLFPLSLFYWVIIFWRNIFYNLGIFVSYNLPCKVISIGNITTGGTGKTPAVIFFAEFLKNRGFKIGILSRGYGRNSKGTIDLKSEISNKKNWKYFGEEPVLISQKLINIPIVIDNNRYRGGKYLYDKYKPQLIILDDGFQHRSLNRDLDINLINANQPKHLYKLLPYGLLREPWQHLKRSDIVIVTKMNIKAPSSFIINKLRSLNINHYHSKYEPSNNLLDINGEKINLAKMKNKRALAISGIGDPLSFELTLKMQNIDFIDHITFNDHHEYKDDDFYFIEKKILNHKPDFLITTEKDLIKLKYANKNIINKLFALPMQFSISKLCLDIILQKLDLN
jgi:tetraacyldisaccharide 4'-kinase